MSLPLLAWLIPNWRNLHFAIAATIILTIPFYFLMPESLYWLTNNKFEKETRRIVHTIEENRLYHGCTKPVCQVSKTRRNSTSSNQEPRITLSFVITVALCSLFWFTGALIYFGLSFSTDEFVGDRY